MHRKIKRRASALAVVQHHVAEGPGEIQSWAQKRSVAVTVLRGDLKEPLPKTGTPVILLGGPYSLLDPPPWLAREQRWVDELVAAGTPILGICLGAQLLAASLGASVHALAAGETGWTWIRLTDRRDMKVLQWHDDGFTLPPRARLLASSAQCRTQLFTVKDRFVGMQFHPEWNSTSVSELNFFFGNECPIAPSDDSDTRHYSAVRKWFHEQLDRWFQWTP